MSKKIYKGYELMKAIANGEIKEGSRFYMRYETSCYDCVVIYSYFGIIREDDNREISFNNLKYNTFELIEDESIDIESIEKLNELSDCEERNIKINELIQAVKQLDKKVKELENKEYCQVCGVELTEENGYMKNMCNECKYGEEDKQ